MRPSCSGYLRIHNPEPEQWLDVGSGREFNAWEKNGSLGGVDEASFDIDKLTMTFVPRGKWSKVGVFNSADDNFFGVRTGNQRIPSHPLP